MLETLVAAAGKVLDLLLKRGEHRQVKAQTALAERELQEKESRIVPATMADVRRYDVNLITLESRIRRRASRSTLRSGGGLSEGESWPYTTLTVLVVLVLVILAFVFFG